eukprot:1354701-Pyramimonas_sp.AAC.1
MDAARDKLADRQRPWRVASSPADVAHLSMERAGWEFPSSSKLRDDLGTAWNLLQISQSEVRSLVQEGAARASDRQALERARTRLARLGP